MIAGGEFAFGAGGLYMEGGCGIDRCVARRGAGTVLFIFGGGSLRPLSSPALARFIRALSSAVGVSIGFDGIVCVVVVVCKLIALLIRSCRFSIKLKNQANF